MSKESDSRRKLGAAFWALALASSGVVAFMFAVASSEHDGLDALSTFTSLSDLQNFVESTRSDSLAGHYDAVLTPEADGELSDETQSADYSSTNIQVAGVDESDMVKTNGEQIFIASRDAVTVFDAGDDGDMAVLSVIDTDAFSSHLASGDITIRSMFVTDDRLVVFIETYASSEPYVTDEYDSYVYLPPEVVSWAAVMDISDPGNPIVLSATGVSGHGSSERLVDGVAYLIAIQSIWYYEEGVPLPVAYNDGSAEPVEPSDILYDPDSCQVDSYVNVLSLDVFSGQFRTVSVMSSWASTIYMTVDSLYLTFQKWSGDIVFAVDVASPEDSSSARTTIYKFSVDGLSVQPVAMCDVEGWLLNQFSMDESSGFLRVATTTSWSTVENAVYVLDGSLAMVGEVTGLAPTERIFSARFVGDTLYLVTFLLTDPLFIIDLSDPYSPEVLGELEIPGFSTYLHPVGDDLLIGVGREWNEVKVSVFDVSDPTEPVEVDKIGLGDSLVPDDYEMYSYSEAEWNHKAFMYDPARRLLVLPLSVVAWGNVDLSGIDWDGFCVLEIHEDGGIEALGYVEHPDYALRSLHIEDTLYTVSSSTISSWTIPGLDPIGSIVYHEDEGSDYIIVMVTDSLD